MANANVQPIYTLSPSNVFSGVADIPLNTEYSYAPASITYLDTQGEVFYSTNSEGNYIYRIRFVAMGDSVTNTTVTAKLIYVFIGKKSVSQYALYKTLAMPGVTVSNTVKSPELEMYFPNGLLIPYQYGIYVAASTNYTTTSQVGDGLFFSVEAGSYTI